MRIPERAKPLEGGVGLEMARLTGAAARCAGASVMRKAPAPGAEVAMVLARATHRPTPPEPGPRALPKGCS